MDDIEAVKAQVMATTIANEGVLKYQNRDYQAAKALFEKALRLVPSSTDILLKFARAALALEQFKETSDALTKLLALDPNNTEAREMLENCSQEKYMKEIVKAMSHEIKKGNHTNSNCIAQ